MAKKDADNRQDKPSVDLEVAGDAQTDPRGQTKGDTPQPQMLQSDGKPLALEGSQPAVVNPALDTISVSIPTGFNEDGTTKFDNFVSGKQYEVDPSVLEIKNTEGVALLVEVEGGGE